MVIAERLACRGEPAAIKTSRFGRRTSSAWRAVAGESADRLDRRPPSFKGSNSLALTAGALSSVAAMAIHSVVDFNMHIPANALLMAFIFALLANPAAGPPARSDQTADVASPWTRVVFGFAPALGIWLAVAALPTWPAEYYGEKSRRLLSDYHALESPEIAREAEKYARLAMARDPKNPELYYYLGESQFLLAGMNPDTPEGDDFLTASVEAYKNGLQLTPQDVRLVLCVAWSLNALKRFDEAEIFHKRALELDSNSGKVHSSYADHLRRKGNATTVESEYSRFFAEADAEYKIASDLHVGLAAYYGRERLAKDRKAKETPPVAPPPLQP